MRTDLPIVIYANTRGQDPMRMLKSFQPDELPDNEHEIAYAIEKSIELFNNFTRADDTQIVVMQDGLIVAIEAQTSRALLWCN